MTLLPFYHLPVVGLGGNDSEPIATPANRESTDFLVSAPSRVDPLTDGEALAWLCAQPGARIRVGTAALGRQWGWNPARVGRRLKAWGSGRRCRPGRRHDHGVGG